MTWATSVPILVFLCLSVLDLDPMYTTDRRQTKASLNAPPIRGGGIIIIAITLSCSFANLRLTYISDLRPAAGKNRGERKK